MSFNNHDNEDPNGRRYGKKQLPTIVRTIISHLLMVEYIYMGRVSFSSPCFRTREELDRWFTENEPNEKDYASYIKTIDLIEY